MPTPHTRTLHTYTTIPHTFALPPPFPPHTPPHTHPIFCPCLAHLPCLHLHTFVFYLLPCYICGLLTFPCSGIRGGSPYLNQPLPCTAHTWLHDTGPRTRCLPHALVHGYFMPIRARLGSSCHSCKLCSSPCWLPHTFSCWFIAYLYTTPILPDRTGLRSTLPTRCHTPRFCPRFVYAFRRYALRFLLAAVHRYGPRRWLPSRTAPPFHPPTPPPVEFVRTALPAILTLPFLGYTGSTFPPPHTLPYRATTRGTARTRAKHRLLVGRLSAAARRQGRIVLRRPIPRPGPHNATNVLDLPRISTPFIHAAPVASMPVYRVVNTRLRGMAYAFAAVRLHLQQRLVLRRRCLDGYMTPYYRRLTPPQVDIYPYGSPHTLLPHTTTSLVVQMVGHTRFAAGCSRPLYRTYLFLLGHFYRAGYAARLHTARCAGLCAHTTFYKHILHG